MSKNQKASDFVIAIAHDFTTTKRENKRVDEWMKLITAALIDDYIEFLPENIKIEANLETKKCLLLVSNILVKLIKNTEHNEKFTSDLISAAIRPINTHCQELIPYSFNVLISAIGNLDCGSCLNELSIAAEKGSMQ